MNKEEQIEFVKRFMENVQEDVIKKIESGRVPEEWNGIELREMVKMHVERGAYWFNDKKRTARYKNFKNTMITENLY